MAYTPSQADKIADALRSLPAVDRDRPKLNKQGLITYLAAEIIGLQERGYTLDQVVWILRAAGLDLTKATLKTYLRRMKQRVRTSAQKRGGRSESRPRAAGQTSRKARLFN